MSTSTPPGGHLRLVWPQRQGAGTASASARMPDVPLPAARHSRELGTAVLQAVLPDHDGPTAVVPVRSDDTGVEERDGIEAGTAAWSSWTTP